jgi:hypothetical protein
MPILTVFSNIQKITAAYEALSKHGFKFTGYEER